MTVSAQVRAVVTIEFPIGSWGGDSTFNSLSKQCQREAINTIVNKFAGKVTIIGTPQIKVATFMEDAR